ncbi:hypothetical protein [Clostridium sp. C8]|jgi:hypothetical protein|nr:hypothetical protein [Clostridium sp. C8]
MKNKNYNNLNNPASSNYDEKIKNKANEKTPYGENEPSTRTTYK